MHTPKKSTRRVLLSTLLFVTVFATVIWPATNDPALIVAARDGNSEVVRSLLAKRVNVNEAARDGSTAVLWAVYQSDIGMVRALVTAGANLNTPNKYGITPLLQASRTGDTPMIAELLKSGADPNSASREGTQLHLKHRMVCVYR